MTGHAANRALMPNSVRVGARDLPRGWRRTQATSHITRDDVVMTREFVADAGWLGKRSGVLTCLAMCLAALATAAAFIYLKPVENDTWLNLALGVLLLAAPLTAKPPLTRTRLLVSALVWIVLGLPAGMPLVSPCSMPGFCLV